MTVGIWQFGSTSQVRDLERRLVHERVLRNSARNEAAVLRKRAESAEAALENLAQNGHAALDSTGQIYVTWAWVRLLAWGASAGCAYWAAFWSWAAVVPVVGFLIHAAMVWGVHKIQREG